jgi:hypothetical protein
MATIVLRVRLTTGDHLDVTYEETDTDDADLVAEHAISVLADESGVLRSMHGNR